jgi:hypothetical protein
MHHRLQMRNHPAGSRLFSGFPELRLNVRVFPFSAVLQIPLARSKRVDDFRDAGCYKNS